MSQDESLGTVLDVPEINPFQLDGGGIGGIARSVNLFRGDVGFDLGLVSLPGRNGLDVSVSAHYRSNVGTAAAARNLEAPTGALGLGWTLPFDRIIVQTSGSGAPGDWTFALVHDDAANRLYRTTRRWRRGTLPVSVVSILDTETMAGDLRKAFLKQGLVVGSTASVRIVQRGQEWLVDDPVHEYTLSIENSGTNLTVYDGGLAYETESFDFSRIRYYPRYQRWEITHPDGLTSVFGGRVSTDKSGVRTSEGQTVQWGVRWGAWLGPSTRTRDGSHKRVQEQYPTAWNLSGGRTPWGDEVRFAYEQVLQKVGVDGLPYTKACYLSRITDVFGRAVTFIYGQKTFQSAPDKPREYLDPCKATPNETPDAYQSCYETKYLQRLDVIAEDSKTPLYSLRFGYELKRFASLPGGSPPTLAGDTYKRVLTSVRKVMPDGSALPDVAFGYYGAAGTNPGALRTVTYAEGGQITYRYAQKQLSECVRHRTVVNPYQPGGPRVWFGPDYVVVVWCGPGGALTVDIYTWIGRWSRHLVERLDNSVDPGDIRAETEAEFFVLHYGKAGGQSSRIHAFHKNNRVLNGWLHDPANPRQLETARREVTTGRRFFLINDRQNSILTRVTWQAHQQKWVTDTPNLCPDLTGTKQYFTGAVNDLLVVLCYDVDSASGYKKNRIRLCQLNELGSWHLGPEVQDKDLTITGTVNDRSLDWNFRWTVTPWGATAAWVTVDQQSYLDYSVVVYLWNAARSSMRRSVEVPNQRVPKTPSARPAFPYVAQASPHGLVRSGPTLLRYDGVDWHGPDTTLLLQNKPSDGDLFWFAQGPDYVLKAENTANRVLSVVQVFDPNTARWESKSLYDNPPQGQLRLRRYCPSAARDFLSFDTDAYSRGTSTKWIDQLDQAALSFTGADTTTVINGNATFLTYFVPGADGTAKTKVHLVSDGVPRGAEEIAERLFQLVRDDGTTEPDVEGRGPAGPGSFVTFPLSDKRFDEARSITLHRFVQNSVCQPITDHPVSQVSVEDGFQTVTHLYEFDTSTAACDASGRVVKYYRSVVHAGTNKKHGRTEFRFINGLGGDGGGAGSGSYALLDGLVKTRTLYDASGKLVASTTSSWSVQDTVLDRPGGAPVRLRGGYVRAETTTESLDGVSRTSFVTYDDVSGRVLSRSTTIANSEGKDEIHQTAIRYGHEVYEALWHANCLGEVVQNTTRILIPEDVPVVTSSRVTTWKPFERTVTDGSVTVWHAHGTYHWLGGDGASDFDFSAWSAPNSPPADWQKDTEVTRRDPHGLVLEREAPVGVLNATLHDRQGCHPVASFTNASPWRGDAFYCGFESYESCPGLSVQDPASVVRGMSNTGSRALRLPKSDNALTLTLHPRRGGSYLLSFWAKTDAGFSSSQQAGWKLTLGGNALPDLVVTRSGEWRYYCQRIDVPAGSKDITLSCVAFNDGDPALLVDDLAFSCYRGQHRVSVYTEPHMLVTEELGPYDAILRRRWDPLQRIVAQTDETQGVVRVVASYLARAGGNAFSSTRPNCQTSLQPMGKTYLDRFRDGGDWRRNWTTTTPSQWRSVDGALRHENSEAGSISLSHPAFTTDYCVHVNVSSSPGTSGTIGLAVGTNLTVVWDASTTKWILTSSTNTVTAPNTAPSPGRSWLLVLMAKTVLFHVDGRCLFSEQLTKPAVGAPTIVAGFPAEFTNVVVGASCQVGATFFDGAGNPRQGHSVEDGGVVVTATLYDEIGRTAATTKPALCVPTKSTPLLTYRPRFVTAMDWSSGVLTGEVADAHPEDEGYPYSRQRFEASPLARPVEHGIPGKKSAITSGGHTARTTYGTNSQDFPPTKNLPAGKCFLRTVTDQDGRVTVHVTDALHRPVLDAVLVDKKQKRYLVSSYTRTYDSTGRTETTRVPNYHNPPDPSTRDRWTRVLRYDMSNRCIESIEPNSGKTTAVYDRRGLPRFFQDAAAAAAGFVGYRKFDDLGRLLEEGTFPATWNRDELQHRANQDPTFPGTAQQPQPSRLHHYDGDGSDVRQMGRRTGASITAAGNGTQDIEVSMYYDERSRLRSEKVSVNSRTYSTSYQYDNLGNIAGVKYASGVSVQYVRDSVGRVTEVKDAGGTVLARYSYDAADRVVTEVVGPSSSSPVSTQYEYSPQGWPEKIASSGYTETLQYTQGGYQNAGYYSGKVAAQSVQYTLPDGSTCPREVTYRLSYDEAGRLAVAECSADGTARPAYSMGLDTPVQYDDNGNIRSVTVGAETQRYTYESGTDFVCNTDGSKRQDYVRDPAGAVHSATPRKISSIAYELLTRQPALFIVDGQRITVQYDERNHRLLRNGPGGTRVYLRNPAGWPLVEGSDPGTNTADRTEYLYGPAGLFGLRRSGRLHPVLRDHLRSPRVVLDDKGSVVTALHYEPYGAVIPEPHGIPDILHYRFAGYELDPETGLYNSPSRLYDPVLRRFYSVDPKLQFASPYPYAGNDPLTLVDPGGAAAWWAIALGAAVGLIVTVGTGGLGAVALGMGLGAGMAVGAAAGALGAVAGDLTTAGIAGEPLTGKRVLADVLAGAAGGLVGAGIGGAASSAAMRTAYTMGSRSVGLVARLGQATALTLGGAAAGAASSGVAAAMTGQPFLSSATGLNVLLGGVAGAGGALMASGAHFGFFGAMPVELTEAEFGEVAPIRAETGQHRMLTFVSQEAFEETRASIESTHGSVEAVFQLTADPDPRADVIAVHGVGRYVFPYTEAGYSRPMSARLFLRYLQQHFPRWQTGEQGSEGTAPIKLLVCFSALPGRFGSVGQTLASGLGRPTYAGRGIVYPDRLSQRRVVFNP